MARRSRRTRRRANAVITATRPRETMIVDTIRTTVAAGTTFTANKPDQIPPRRAWRLAYVDIEISASMSRSTNVVATALYSFEPHCVQLRLLGPPERGVATTIQPTQAVRRPFLVVPGEVIKLRLRNNRQQDWFTEELGANTNDLAVDHPLMYAGQAGNIYVIVHRVYELSQEYELLTVGLDAPPRGEDSWVDVPQVPT